MAKQYGLVIDLKRCIGCQTCTVACKSEHELQKGSGIRIETVGGPYRNTPTGKYPDLHMHFLPIPCMHCAQASCIDACPTEAIYRRDDGMVLLNEEKCSGCQDCVSACLYGALQFNPDKNVVFKCNLCVHRIEQGIDPFCVVCCEVGAIFFGDIGSPSSDVSRRIASKNAVVYKPELGTGPAIYYCPA